MSQPPAKPAAGPGGPPVPGAEPSPGGPPQPAPQSKRLQQTQAQVEEVVDIMRVNVDKVLERDQKLSELDDRADSLLAGASQFEASAGKLKRKFWWKNMKMMLVMGAVVAVLVIIVGAWLYNKFSGPEPVQQLPPPPPVNQAVAPNGVESVPSKSEQNGMPAAGAAPN